MKDLTPEERDAAIKRVVALKIKAAIITTCMTGRAIQSGGIDLDKVGKAHRRMKDFMGEFMFETTGETDPLKAISKNPLAMRVGAPLQSILRISADTGAHFHYDEEELDPDGKPPEPSSEEVSEIVATLPEGTKERWSENQHLLLLMVDLFDSLMFANTYAKATMEKDKHIQQLSDEDLKKADAECFALFLQPDEQ